MNAHWHNGHKEYHKEQKRMAKQRRESDEQERTRFIAEEAARRAEATGDEYQKRIAAGIALNAEGDHNAAAKAWRKIIKEWPGRSVPYHNLANVMVRSGRYAEAAAMYLKAMELDEDGSKRWAEAAASAFETLKTDDCREVPKPEWWDDEALKALSVRVVALAPDVHQPCAMRARVLCGDTLAKAHWNVGPRTSAEIKEASTWYRRAARLTPRGEDFKRHYEQFAQQCDEFADPLLAKEEAEAAKARAAAEDEAAKARAAAEAEAAEALKIAEAKATAAAEELLAEEEKEKEQATSTKAGKAKQSQSKKGKGNGKR